MDERKIKWSDIRKNLQELGQREVIHLVKDLYDLSNENRLFLEAHFSSVLEQNEAIIAYYKQEISYCFFGKHELSDDLPKLREARRIIQDYRKATRDLSGTLDLMLYYVETGTEFTNTYGDINEAFYNSLLSVLSDFCASILKTLDPAQLYLRFEDRLADLRRAAYDIGWGYGDDVQVMIGDLELHYK